MAKKNLAKVEDIEIINQDNTFRVSSMQIAKHFDKQHNNVLRDIENLIKDLPEDFHHLNFEPTEESVVIPASGGIRKDPAYMLTRDGFSLLAMGFTGKKAIDWKIKYLEAFNAMEKQLIAQQSSQELENPLMEITPETFSVKQDISRSPVIFYDKNILSCSAWALCSLAGAKHEGFIEKIEEQIKNYSINLRNKYIIPAEYTDLNQNVAKIPTYNLTLAGFCLFSKYLTGKYADYTRIVYAETFEQHVQDKNQTSNHIIPRFKQPKLSQKEILPVMGLLKFWAYLEGRTVENCIQELCDYLQIPKIETLLIKDLHIAMNFMWDSIFTRNPNNTHTPAKNSSKEVVLGLIDFLTMYIDPRKNIEHVVNNLNAACGTKSFHEIGEEEINKALFFLWGEIMATMHGGFSCSCRTEIQRMK